MVVRDYELFEPGVRGLLICNIAEREETPCSLKLSWLIGLCGKRAVTARRHVRLGLPAPGCYYNRRLRCGKVVVRHFIVEGGGGGCCSTPSHANAPSVLRPADGYANSRHSSELHKCSRCTCSWTALFVGTPDHEMYQTTIVSTFVVRQVGIPWLVPCVSLVKFATSSPVTCVSASGMDLVV